VLAIASARKCLQMLFSRPPPRQSGRTGRRSPLSFLRVKFIVGEGRRSSDRARSEARSEARSFNGTFNATRACARTPVGSTAINVERVADAPRVGYALRMESASISR